MVPSESEKRLQSQAEGPAGFAGVANQNTPSSLNKHNPPVDDDSADFKHETGTVVEFVPLQDVGAVGEKNTRVLVTGKKELFVFPKNRIFELRKEDMSAWRVGKVGDQKPVIFPRMTHQDRARGITPGTVRLEPLKTQGFADVSANVFLYPNLHGSRLPGILQQAEISPGIGIPFLGNFRKL
jgi:hypothetical protein